MMTSTIYAFFFVNGRRFLYTSLLMRLI